MTEETTSPATEAAQQAAPNFAIQRIYLKDISFETPMGAEAFLKPKQPKIQQDLNVQVGQLSEELTEVVLLLTITATVENRTVFLVEVKQAGIFAMSGFEPGQFTQVVNTTCPQILFPYAREAVDSILSRGGFPPLMLAPINFDAVFVQAVQVARKQAEVAPPSEATVN